jgi:transcriptional regulator with XRE-family HTH domain
LYTDWTLAREPVRGALVSAQPPHVPLERLRQAAQRAVDESSLRKVAIQVGLSPMGLSLFLRGNTEPFKPTVRKLVEWYVRDAASRRGLDEATASAALSLLLDGMPEPEASATRERVLAALREGYTKSGETPPEWLTKSED